MSELLVRVVTPDGRVFFVPFEWIGMNQWMRYCASTGNGK
jgi:hypothetical protein